MKKTISTTKTRTGWLASQELMDILIANGFRQVDEVGGFLPGYNQRYYEGMIHYFRKNGDCRIAFLKDGRVHVLNGPYSRWQLYECLTTKDLVRLMDFCSWSSSAQLGYREALSGKVA